jgi:hypothetical protein
MDLRSRILVIRAQRMLRRANKLRRRRLATELAGYRTAADLADLEALLDSCPDAQTQEIRGILAGQQWRRLH